MKYFAGVFLLVTIAFPRNNLLDAQERIVGGDAGSIENSNYQVSIREYNEHMCGGAILNHNTILTAAHCMDGVRPGILSVSNGATIANNGIIHKVEKIIQHPKFDAETFENDISILKIKPPIKYTNSSEPIKLGTKRLKPGTNVKITGWGKQSEKEKKSVLGNKPLRYVIVQVVNQTKCAKDYEEFEPKIYDGNMCASAPGKDSCQGDSGGPLVSGIGDARRLVGVVSFGFGCAHKKYPGVYTFVPAFLDFIKKHM